MNLTMFIPKAPQPKSQNSRESYKVSYVYIDASGYKRWGEFYVLGELSLSDMQRYLFDEEFFVPERIGVQSLLPDIRTEDDHYLHKFVGTEPAGAAECLCTAEELVERCRRANEEDWFRSMQWL